MASTRKARRTAKKTPETRAATPTRAQVAAEAKPEARAPVKPRPQASAPKPPTPSAYAKRVRRKRDLLNQVRDPGTSAARANEIYAELGGLEDVPALSHQEIVRLGG